MLTKSVSRKLVAGALLGMMALSGLGALGTGVAHAASGYSEPGGGVWNWRTVPGISATSSYYHRSKQHSASAQVGAGSVKASYKGAGSTAKATAIGIGTCRVWYGV